MSVSCPGLLAVRLCAFLDHRSRINALSTHPNSLHRLGSTTCSTLLEPLHLFGAPPTPITCCTPLPGRTRTSMCPALDFCICTHPCQLERTRLEHIYGRLHDCLTLCPPDSFFCNMYGTRAAFSTAASLHHPAGCLHTACTAWAWGTTCVSA